MSDAMIQSLPAYFPYTLGEPLVEGSVTLFPLFGKSSDDGGCPALVPLSQAQDQGAVRVQEVSESARVGQVEVENVGLDIVLVLAGTALKGGLQDRQVGHDILLLPGTTTSIEAFCVEQGRWNPSREGVSTNAAFRAEKTLTSRSVRHAATVDRDQGRVWQEVTQTNRRHQVMSPTDSLFATLESTSSDALAHREQATERIRTHLTRDSRPIVGVAWGSPDDGLEIRAFANVATARAFVETLVNTIALDAVAPHRGETRAPMTAAHVTATVTAAHSQPSHWERGQRQYTERKQAQPVAYSACWYLTADRKPVVATCSWQQVA